MLAQPFGSWASLSTSPQPRAFLGHPNATAIGLGIAMTSGVVAMDGGLTDPMRSGLSATEVFCRSRPVQELAAGDQTSGRGPSTDSSQPRARASAAPPLALLVTSTVTQLPPTRWPS